MNHTTTYPRKPRVKLPLRISNLTLENFRLFRSVACEVPEQLVLIGANGVGKTSILNGLAAGLENLRFAI